VSSVEYALLLVAILIVGAVAWRMLGKEVRAKVECAGVRTNCANGGAVASNGSAAGMGAGAPRIQAATRPRSPTNVAPEFALAAQHQRTVVRRSGAGPAAAGHRRAIRATRGRRLPRWQWAPVAGFTRLDNSQLEAAGINPASLSDPSSGFKAAVYTDGNGHYVVSYKGSQSGKDWEKPTSNKASVSTTRNTTRPSALAKDAKAAFGDNMVIVGHSLGGGLAARPRRHHTPAVVFNPAGVTDKTWSANHIDPATAARGRGNGQRPYRGQG